MPATPYIALAVATFIYLLVDIYPAIKSFLAVFLTPSFWLLWVIFVVLSLIAWGSLQVAISAKALAWVGRPELATLLIVVLATLGTVTILQSFTLKIASVKVADVESLVGKYREAVLVAIGEKKKERQSQAELRVAAKLTKKYSGKAQELKGHYHSVFSFGGATTESITQELEALQSEANKSGLAFEQLMAVRIVKADLKFARSLL